MAVMLMRTQLLLAHKHYWRVGRLLIKSECFIELVPTLSYYVVRNKKDCFAN